MENAPIIYFVVPCYNEEEVLPLTAGILGKKLVTLINAGVIGEESRILLVDDGSRQDFLRQPGTATLRFLWMRICRMMWMPVIR